MGQEVGSIEMGNLQAIVRQVTRESLQVGACRDEDIIFLSGCEGIVLIMNDVDYKAALPEGVRDAM